MALSVAQSRYCREKRGTQNIETLVESGRRLTNIEFVSFAVCFRDFLGRAVAPWALAVQSQSYEPWALKPMGDLRETVLEQNAAMVHHLHQLLRVLVLLRQHLPHSEMKLFLQAFACASPSDLFFENDVHEHPARWSLRSHRWRPRKPPAPRRALCVVAFAKGFPSLWHALPQLLDEVKPTFKGVELIVLPHPDANGAVCLGAHCQCAFRTNRRTRGRAPWLVAPAGVTQERVVPSPGLPPVRFAWWRADGPSASGPTANMFRKGIRAIRLPGGGSGRLCRCQVGPLLPQVFLAVDGALRAMGSFVTAVQEASGAMYGMEGSNAGMRRLLDAMCQCFDFTRLCVAAPQQADVTAFSTLVNLLKPYLQRTSFPP